MTPSDRNASRRIDPASLAQTNPGIMAKATQLHAVKVAAKPATTAKRKPNPAPSVENSAALPVAPPIVLPAITSRPKPSATLAFQNPAAQIPASNARPSVNDRRLETASAGTGAALTRAYAASM